MNTLKKLKRNSPLEIAFEIQRLFENEYNLSEKKSIYLLLNELINQLDQDFQNEFFEFSDDLTSLNQKIQKSDLSHRLEEKKDFDTDSKLQLVAKRINQSLSHLESEYVPKSKVYPSIALALNLSEKLFVTTNYSDEITYAYHTEGSIQSDLVGKPVTHFLPKDDIQDSDSYLKQSSLKQPLIPKTRRNIRFSVVNVSHNERLYIVNLPLY